MDIISKVRVSAARIKHVFSETGATCAISAIVESVKVVIVVVADSFKVSSNLLCYSQQ